MPFLISISHEHFDCKYSTLFVLRSWCVQQFKSFSSETLTHEITSIHGKDALSKPKFVPPPIPPFVCTERISMGATIYFDSDSAIINHTDQKKLDAIINQLEWRKVYLVVIGYADSAGSRKYNQGLSTKRAYVVQKYLIDGGVQAENSYAEGKVGLAPSWHSDLHKNRNNNRVAEVEIVGLGCQKKII